MYTVYLQLTDACNEIKAGISYYSRRKKEPSSGNGLGCPIMDRVDRQPIIIFRDVFFELVGKLDEQ